MGGGRAHTGPQGPWRDSLGVFRDSGDTLGPEGPFDWGAPRTCSAEPSVKPHAASSRILAFRVSTGRVTMSWHLLDAGC